MKVQFALIVLMMIFSLRGQAQTLTPFTPTTVDSRIELNFGRAIAVGGSNIIHQVWMEVTTQHNIADITGKIMYRISPDGGKSWTPNKALTGEIRTGNPKIAAYGPYVYITYHQVEATGQFVKLLFSQNVGIDWFESSTLPTPIVVGSGGHIPSVAAYGTIVHIVYAAYTPANTRSEIFHRGAYIDNSKLVWISASKMISSNDGRSSWTPDVAVEKSNVYVSWTDERFNAIDCADRTSDDCYEEVYYRRSDSYGTSWYPEKRLTTSPQLIGHNASSIAVSNGTVHIGVYRKPPGSVYYIRLTNNGTDQQPEVPIAVDSTIAYGRPVVVAQGANVQIAFHGMISGYGVKLYRTKSTNGGVSFGSDGASKFSEILSAYSWSYQPSIAVDAFGKTHMIFAGKNLADPKFRMFYGSW
jgi:hypothetical protein